jgi:hypothetical protein
MNTTIETPDLNPLREVVVIARGSVDCSRFLERTEMGNYFP